MGNPMNKGVSKMFAQKLQLQGYFSYRYDQDWESLQGRSYRKQNYLFNDTRISLIGVQTQKL